MLSKWRFGWLACFGLVFCCLIVVGVFHVVESSEKISFNTISIHLSLPLTLIAFGDNGSGSSAQMDLAKEMALQYQKEPFQIALLLGDNIYETGDVKKYGKKRFLIPYKPLLDNGVRFMPVLGNHDAWLWGLHTQDEITFFKMPNSYYDFIIKNVHFYALNTNQFDGTQVAWLKGHLSRDPEEWKIVYGHHPMFSSGEHGSTPVLQSRLKPLLEQYHVDLYLCGHDHDYERFKPVNGVLYIVSGGGGARIRSFKKPLPESLVRLQAHHFLNLVIDQEQLTFQAIDQHGQIIDSGKIMKNQKAYLRAAG